MIAIVDYGVGNLRSVEKAFQYIGCNAVVSSENDVILGADAVVLPGVGAYADAVGSLRKSGMDEVIEKVIGSGRPFLGICLGMQLLFDYSEEGGGKVQGLGFFKGAIRQLPLDMNLKVPHMGWNSIRKINPCALYDGLPDNPHVYFVHSYYLDAQDRDIVTATTFYGMDFDVSIGCGRVFATQFHPEKSGDVGLTILRNFAELVKA